MDEANNRDAAELAEAAELLAKGRTMRRKVLHRIRQRRYLKQKRQAKP